MEIANELYNVYKQLFDESTDEFWEQHASNLGYSKEILQDIFKPKDDEQGVMVQFAQEYISENQVLRELLNTLGESAVNIVESEAVKNAFLGILDTMEASEIQEIIDDEENYYFGVGLCEGILMALDDAISQMVQESITTE